MKNRPIIFGEVLLDVFEDGSRWMGGSSLNVAWNLKGLGADPLFIGRIGQDAYGEEIQEHLSNWGLDQSGLQIDPKNPTAFIQVYLDENKEAKYKCQDESAIDHIDADQAIRNLGEHELIYFGSYSQRHANNRKCLAALLQSQDLHCMVDINIRPPWYNPEIEQILFEAVDTLKMNEHEYSELFGQEFTGSNEQLTAIQQKFPGKKVIVTFGDKGAYLVSEQDELHRPSRKITELVDTVGAGDGFCAGLIYGKLLGMSVEEALAPACHFAAQFCEIKGATSSDRSFYEQGRQYFKLKV